MFQLSTFIFGQQRKKEQQQQKSYTGLEETWDACDLAAHLLKAFIRGHPDSVPQPQEKEG